MTTYAEFRLRIERGPTAGTFKVEASGLGGEQHGSFEVPFSPTELENFILRIGRTRRGVRRIESPEMELARTFGERLFSAVMSEKVGELYRAAFTEARAERQGLRITLSLTDVPELGAIPWEYLYDPPDFLAVSAWTPVVRYLDLPRPRRALEIQLPLRILAVVSAPSDSERLDGGLERQRLEAALRPLIDANAVAIDWLDQPSLGALNRKLRPDIYHILHFIGHGGFDERSEEGALLFEDETGRGKLVSGDQLGTVLRDKLNLRLVLLNSCEGARNSTSDPFSGVATSLVERDIPAVIGMQFEITDRAAILFASEFYAMLAEGQPVDRAIAEARLAIYADQNDVEWGTPVLFMRVADGRLFTVADAPAMPRVQPEEVTAIASDVAAAAAAAPVAAAGAAAGPVAAAGAVPTDVAAGETATEVVEAARVEVAEAPIGDAAPGTVEEAPDVGTPDPDAAPPETTAIEAGPPDAAEAPPRTVAPPDDHEAAAPHPAPGVDDSLAALLASPSRPRTEPDGDAQPAVQPHSAASPSGPQIIDGPPVGTWPTGATPMEPVDVATHPAGTASAASADAGPWVEAGSLASAGAGHATTSGAATTLDPRPRTALDVPGTAPGDRSADATRRTTRKLPWVRIAIGAGAVLAILIVALLLTFRPGGASIHAQTSPGTGVMTVTGSGFKPREIVNLSVNGVFLVSTRADAQGGISEVFEDPSNIRGHLTANGEESGQSAGQDVDPTIQTGMPADTQSPTDTEAPTDTETPTDPGGDPPPLADVCKRPADGGFPAALSERSTILFHSDRDGGDRDLYAVDPRDGSFCRLTSSQLDDENPTWSPDHQQILYARHDQDGEYRLYIWGAHAKPEPLTTCDANCLPAWSSSNWIAFTRTDDSQIWRIRPDGSGEELVATETTARAPAWSLDGERLAFMAQFDGRDDFDIAVINPTTGDSKRIDRSGTSELNPTWHPTESDTIVFVMDSGQPGRGDNELRTMDVGTETMSDPLTSNDVQDGNPVWSPEGDRIAFYQASPSGYDLWVMNRDGSDPQPLVVGGGENLDPRWN